MTDTSPVANIAVIPAVSSTTVPNRGLLTVPLGNFYSSDNRPVGNSISLTGCALTGTGLVDTTITGTINGDVIQFSNVIASSDTTGVTTTYPIIGVRLPDGTRKIGTPVGGAATDAQLAAAKIRVDKKRSMFAQTRRAAMARANLRKAAGIIPRSTTQTQVLTAARSNATPVITQVTGVSAQDVEMQAPYSVTSQNTQDTSAVAASEMVTKEYFGVA